MAISRANVTSVSVITVDKNCIGNTLSITKIKGVGKMQMWNFQIPFFLIQDCFKNQVCALIRRKRLGGFKGLCSLSI